MLLVVLILLVQMACYMPQISATPLQYNNATLLLSKGIQVASYMDVAGAQPCEDFYSWTCGGWVRTHPATKSKPKTSYLAQLQDVYLQKAALLLQQPHAAEDDPFDTCLKDFYSSCHNDSQMGMMSLPPLEDFVRFEGDWPSITDAKWFEYEYDWLELVVWSKRQFNVDVFISFDAIPAPENPQTFRIKLGAPKLALGMKATYLNDHYASKREEYVAQIMQKLAKFFPDMSAHWAGEVAAQVLEVEQKLAKAIPDAAQRKERFVAELKSSYGNFVDLSRYLQLMFNKTINDKVYESERGYFANLVEVIKLTPKLILANYTYWKIVDQFDFGGDDTHCATRVMSYFPYPVEQLMKRAFPYHNEFAALQELFVAIKMTLHADLRNGTQFADIGSQTRVTLAQKLNLMQLQVMEADYFASFNPYLVKPHQYYSNIMRILAWQSAQIVMKYLNNGPHAGYINVPPHYATQLLPIYNIELNTVQVPMKFLQPHIFWHRTYPEAFKYGTYAYLLAQQIIYGLYNTPVDGDLKIAIKNRGKCLGEQQYYIGTVANLRSRGDVLQRILADNLALHVAYRLYEQWFEGSGAHQTLPFVQCTPKQEFFIAFAQIYCANYHSSVERFTALPESLRVNGAVANFIDFPKTYNCNVESKLAQENKCIL